MSAVVPKAPSFVSFPSFVVNAIPFPFTTKNTKGTKKGQVLPGNGPKVLSSFVPFVVNAIPFPFTQKKIKEYQVLPGKGRAIITSFVTFVSFVVKSVSVRPREPSFVSFVPFVVNVVVFRLLR